MNFPKQRKSNITPTASQPMSESTTEVILKYVGDIRTIEQDFPGIKFRVLLGNYAIAQIPVSLFQAFVDYTDIIDAEVAEPVFFEHNQTSYKIPDQNRNNLIKQPLPFSSQNMQSNETPNINNQEAYVMPADAVCMPEDKSLDGNGVLLGIVDSGINASHPAFQNSDGSSRIIAYFDQNGNDLPTDVSGHGTAVAGIAGGFASSGFEDGYRGIATGASFAIVRLRTFGTSDFSLTSSIMEGVDFIVRTAIAKRMPCAVNISYGTQAGAHNGQSLLETYLDTICDIWQLSIICGTGNDGDKALHASGNLFPGVPERNPFATPANSTAEIRTEQLRIGLLQTDFSFSLWKDFADEITMELQAPDGTTLSDIEVPGAYRLTAADQTTVDILVELPTPYENIQEYFIYFRSQTGFILDGIWTFVLKPRSVKTGYYCIWLSGGETLARDTGFINPNETITLTIPSTALKVVSVGAYNSLENEFASFSGQGFTWQNRYLKPDLVSAGVNVLIASEGESYLVASGTSFSAPMVTGAAAILMQWGIINGNDPFMYGERLKAYLQRGALILDAFSTEIYPNERLGYGVLCIENSIPKN